jgi:mono/diheme cytochrome c family protein
MAMAAAGCQHIGINESNSVFIGRYTQYIWGNIPDQYADLNNPLPASIVNISDGKSLYQMQCLECHGKFGEGDGLAGKQLIPSPANLAFTRRLPVATDAFLFWTIAEGGNSFGSAMPAFGERLSDEEIWQITHYINTGFDFNQGT